MRIVQVNSVYNTGSTGRIVEGIAAAARGRGHETWAVYGRSAHPGPTETYRASSRLDNLVHGARSLLFDAHGLGSYRATSKLVDWLEEIRPDAVGLHNLHGYYLNYKVLFDYLSTCQIPVFWTWHDCWPITGHCAHFIRFRCEKWKSVCHRCPMTSYYPKSLIDRSTVNHGLKKKHFTKISGLKVICPSKWIRDVGRESFLADADFKVINNGVDLSTFKPREDRRAPIVLGVAGIWSQAKGLYDFIALRNYLPENIRIMLVGVSAKQAKSLSRGIETIPKTHNVGQLAEIYSSAAVFCNPTYVDTFPTTNLEALACGIPIVTYRTGGSPESIDDSTGDVVDPGDIAGMAARIMKWLNVPRTRSQTACRSRAERMFDQEIQYERYVDLIESSLS